MTRGASVLLLYAVCAARGEETAPQHGLVGGVTGAVGKDWVSVEFPEPFTVKPVVLIAIQSANGVTGTEGLIQVPRLKDITKTGFKVRLVHPPCENTDLTQSVAYFALEPGQDKTITGHDYMSGTVKIKDTAFTTVNFPSTFKNNVVMLATLQSNNDMDFVTVRTDNVDKKKFSIHMKEEELADNIHAEETVGWYAIEAVGNGEMLGGMPFSTEIRNDINEQWKSLSWKLDGCPGDNSCFPLAYAHPIQEAGADPMIIQQKDLTPTSVNLHVIEDDCKDDQEHPNKESVGLLILGKNPSLVGAGMEDDDSSSLGSSSCAVLVIFFLLCICLILLLIFMFVKKKGPFADKGEKIQDEKAVPLSPKSKDQKDDKKGGGEDKKGGDDPTKDADGKPLPYQFTLFVQDPSGHHGKGEKCGVQIGARPKDIIMEVRDAIHGVKPGLDVRKKDLFQKATDDEPLKNTQGVEEIFKKPGEHELFISKQPSQK